MKLYNQKKGDVKSTGDAIILLPLLSDLALSK